MSDTTIATDGLRSFFERFAASSTAGDADALGRLYAPTILVAGPNGAHAVTPADLMRAIPQRRQLLQSLGCQRTTLVGLEETALDSRYTLARAEWRWDFDPSNGAAAQLTLPSTFIVDRSAEPPRIVVYVMHQDLTAVLRDRGLLPRAT
jgi:hypothetical protein